MPTFQKIAPIADELLEKVGFSWHHDGELEYLVKEQLIEIKKEEAEAYANATEELYVMYEKGAEYVIEHELFDALDIPQALIPVIKKSWIEDRDKHLYGRFDLSGGIDSKPIKLIEFNADTATLLFESCVVQAMLFEYNNLQKSEQFNKIYEAISTKLQTIAQSKKGAFSPFVFASVEGISEEEVTTKLLESMAKYAGLLVSYSTLEDIDLNAEYDFFFKLYPWEDMEEFEANAKTTMLNPAYTLLYQSKGMLAILYKLFPESPYLLETSFEPIEKKYVRKRMFGREGANIEIVENAEALLVTEGEYAHYKSVYQEYTPFVRDDEGLYYQAGVFYSDYACGLGFRRGREILDNMSQYIGHIIK